MARYHLTEDGPKVCSAKIQCPLKKDNPDIQHFDNKAEAMKAYEESQAEQHQNNYLTSTKKPLTLEEKLKTETPVNIDTVLAKNYYEIQKLNSYINRSEYYVNLYSKRKNISQSDQNYIDQEKASIEEYTEKVNEIKENNTPYEKEFLSRPWSRAFLVNNSNGHVHKDMNCSTCTYKTEYQWMTDYSGKTEDEIVDAAGSRACTVCYPSAPVEVLNKPTKMFTEDEVAKQKRQAELAEKKKAQDAKNIFLPDGSKIVLDYGYKQEIKTERSAKTALKECAQDLLEYKTILKNRRDSMDIEEKQAYQNDLNRHQRNVDLLLDALQHKTGVSDKDLFKEVVKKNKKNFDSYTWDYIMREGILD